MAKEAKGIRREDLTPEVLQELIAQDESLTDEEFNRVTEAFTLWPDNQFDSVQGMKDFVEKVRHIASKQEMIDFIEKAKRGADK